MTLTMFHLLSESEWGSIRETQEYSTESLVTEGFIHFSFADQVCVTAARFFTGRTDMLALEVDISRLTNDMRVDHVDGHGDFPHLYGPLNLDAVVGLHKLILMDDQNYKMEAIER